ncbi:MAG TPA: bifunctional DedA family/phosphatase PAP2 family protein [Candidatus Paceibacterota bacterium]
MEHFFLDLFQTHFLAFKHWGYTILFVITLLESIPILGIVIPGQTIVILAGFLVRLKILAFWPAALVASVGAVIGDLIGFFLGRRFGKAVKNPEKMFGIKKEQLQKTQEIIETHSIKTIFFGRLNSLTRTFMPFAAGMSNVANKKFLFADSISAIIWAVFSIVVGYIFGRSFEAAALFIGKFALIATVLVVVIILILRYLKKRHFKISSTDIIVFGTSILSLYLFTVIGESVGHGKLLNLFDARIQAMIETIKTPVITILMLFATIMGNSTDMIIFSAILILFLLWKKKGLDAALVAIAMSSGSIFVNIVKASIGGARPEPGLVEAYGSSFPSGHAVMAMIAATVLSYTVLRKIKNILVRNTFITLIYGFTLVIGLSRVYLNVHWASDVLGGIFGGLFWSTFIIVIFRSTVLIIKRYKRKGELPNIP